LRDKKERNKKKEPVNIGLSEQMIIELDLQATYQGVSRACIVRFAVDEYIRNHPIPQ
jgi:hypothetical protein